jgi:hypothetical protein
MQVHGGIKFGPSLKAAAMFLLGLAAALALPAIVWILSAELRLKRFPADFRAIGPGLLLLFWIFVGTIVLPVIVTVAVGTDMPSLWALQGLFLPVILIVCGASYTLERLYVVNLAVFVAGIAIIATVVAAPIHAYYRNSLSPNDRTYYRLAVTELTRQWHLISDQPVPRISGDDGLAFATAFYSPEHPVYSRPFQYQYTWGMPRATTLQKGWAAMCFVGDTGCKQWMASVAAMEPQHVRIDFEVTPELWGKAGIPATVSALMVAPRAGRAAPVGPVSQGVEDFSSSHRKSSW